jgi:hypothetical protein
MAGIRLGPNEFADLVVAFLLDNIMEPGEILPDNIEFDYITNKMARSGLKSSLMSYYIDTSSITRGKYKMIRGSFTGKDKQNSIVISSSAEDKVTDDDKSTIRNIVKQTLRVIKSHRVRKNGGMPLNEESVDKIIDKVLEEYNREKQ